MKKLVGVSLLQEVTALIRSAICSLCILIITQLPVISENVLMVLVYKVCIGIVVYLLSCYLLNRKIMDTLLKKFFIRSNERRI